jgi:hypothetical protein
MFTYRSDGELSVRCYLIDPKTIDDLDRAVYWGNSAAQYIKDCEDMIDQLKQYQQKIFERVQELETAQYHHRVTLLRENRYYQKRVFYYLIVEKVFDTPGIKPVEIQRTTYSGPERRDALKAFEAYKKSHPGVEAVLDIEKARWEK